LTAAAGNILLVDVENACLVVRGHASFWCVLSNHETIHRNCDKTGSYTCFKLVFHQYLSFDILHDYLSTTCFVCTWWPCPTLSEGPQNLKSETYSSRPCIWYTTWLTF
jgi:hypothetical protein